MKKEQIAILVIVGVMAFSVVGAGLAVLLDDNADQAIQNLIEQEEPEPIFPEGAYTTVEDVTELEIVDLTVGDGETVKAGDTVTVHYQGTLADTGQQFDSSYDRGQPATFALAGLIEGWEEGIPGMKVGGKRRLVIPSEQGYGPAGSPPLIPANADLVFEIELISVGEPDALDAEIEPEANSSNNSTE